MGNTHAVHNGKKVVAKDEMINVNGSTPVVQESTHVLPTHAPLGSVAELTDLQKRLLQDSW